MGKARKHTPEQIVNILRQIEVAVANGKTDPVTSREAGITEQTYYRWRKEYGGLKAPASPPTARQCRARIRCLQNSQSTTANRRH